MTRPIELYRSSAQQQLAGQAHIYFKQGVILVILATTSLGMAACQPTAQQTPPATETPAASPSP